MKKYNWPARSRKPDSNLLVTWSSLSTASTRCLCLLSFSCAYVCLSIFYKQYRTPCIQQRKGWKFTSSALLYPLPFYFSFSTKWLRALSSEYSMITKMIFSLTITTKMRTNGRFFSACLLSLIWLSGSTLTVRPTRVSSFQELGSKWGSKWPDGKCTSCWSRSYAMCLQSSSKLT